MSEEPKEWAYMWGAKVHLRNDMPDDILKDAIETSTRIIKNANYETQGLQCAEQIKAEFDQRWSPYWHCIIGRNFGSFVTHETRRFVFFYIDDKAVMLYKAG